MGASGTSPYTLLNVAEDIQYVKLRGIYRDLIHQHKQGKITDIDFRSKVRAYETLSDFDKRKRYDSEKQWISDLPLDKYTAQQLAAEPSLIGTLQNRLKNATCTEINSQDPVTGHTALYCAARAGCVAGVTFLTEQGADPDLSQRTQSTALHAASFYGHADVVACLLKSGADYRMKNSGKSTAEEEASNNEVKQIFTELHSAPYVRAAANEIDWFSENFPVEHIDEQYYLQQQTLLHCASKKGHVDLVRLLVERRSANLDIVDNNLNSALHLAAYGGHDKVVDYLLNRGCDSTLRNRWGTTAEDEGTKHGDRIISLFRAMRSRDMFEMVRTGATWWFEYYFDAKKPDSVDADGTSLLYCACRSGHVAVARWLLLHGASVNMPMKKSPKSTPLHAAKYYGHVPVVQLLIDFGADLTIKNEHGLSALDEDIPKSVDEKTASKLKQLLRQYQLSSMEQKSIDVHIYDTGDSPVEKVRVHHSAVYADLLNALPDDFKSRVGYFSIARRRLRFDDPDTTIIAAVCRARYTNSKFITTPLCLTFHRSFERGGDIQPSTRQDPEFNSRTFHGQFLKHCKIDRIELRSSATEKQTFAAGGLTFTFAEGTVENDIIFEAKTVSNIDPEDYGLPGCLCLFEARLCRSTDKLAKLPSVSMANHTDAYLYTLAKQTCYWYRSETRQDQLPVLDSVHAFVQHLPVIPPFLFLPIDMIIAASLGQPLVPRTQPVNCNSLVLQQHDATNFPERAYHGTAIQVVPSILIDGFVLPGTVVACGKRISPPPNHIARGRKAFGVEDFAHAVFLSPSVHYSSCGAYAVPFSSANRQMIPVLECSVKRKSYKVYGCTVPGYNRNTGDNLDAIEWRLENPADVVINAVLFIPMNTTLDAAVRERMIRAS